MRQWVAAVPAAACAAFATGAAAQTPFSPQATETCLARTTGYAQYDCIGDAAQVCMKGPGGSSTAGMSSCLDAERAYWDGRLNVAYQALIPVERAFDADNAGMAGAQSAEDSLRAMQRAWIAWRDAACAWDAAQWSGGSGAGPAAIACLVRMTGQQTLTLETRLAQQR